MTSYHWTGDALQSGEFLPADQPETTIALGGVVLATKQRMLACFASQRRTIDALHAPAHERFRPAPQYDFRLPPCPAGRIFYDQFQWGLDSALWCKYAAEALVALRMTPVAAGATFEPCL